MLTRNAEAQPLMNRMHKPDPKRPAHMQDTRSADPVDLDAADRWIFGTVEEARTVLKLPAVEGIKADPFP
jgi:hypothetical protein